MATGRVRIPQRIVVPFNGHVIGEGFNSDTVERVGTALSATQVGEDPMAPGQRAAFAFHMLTSQTSLEKSLNFGAEIDGRYALFSAGGKFSFAESSAVNTTSTYILASCVIANARRFGKDFTPNPSAAPLIARGDLDNFKRAFGDRFTQALHTGGEFHALVRVTSSIVEHQQKIAASLHAELNGLTAAVSFKASFETAQRDTSSHTEVDIQVHQTGGVGEQVQIPGTEADRIREHMNRFAAAVHTGPVAYEAELLTYDTLALPFPPLEELEQKRLVLEDCLTRRQQYWSAISDLEFARSEAARLIFENLPSPEDLVALQNAFRRVLNDLMAHARNVSQGTIPPALFVATDEPVLPRFKRRTASSFAVWWARASRNDPTLLRDETLLIDDIGRAVRGILTVPLDQASPETVEHATDVLEELTLNTGIDHLETPRHRSLAMLPKMIDSPLRHLASRGTEFDDLVGIEGFQRLEELDLLDGRLRDLQALASVAGVRTMHLGMNAITDLTPLAALTGLRELRLERNMIEDLTPLRGLSNLEILDIAGNQISSLQPLAGLPTLRTLSLNANPGGTPAESQDNPLLDARALADLPRLANPFASASELELAVFDSSGTLVRSGIANRIAQSNRFQFVSATDGSHEEIQVDGLGEWKDLNVFPAPVVATAVRFAVGIACTRPGDRSAFIEAAELIRLFPDPLPFGRSFPGLVFRTRLFDSMAPQLFLTVQLP